MSDMTGSRRMMIIWPKLHVQSGSQEGRSEIVLGVAWVLLRLDLFFQWLTQKFVVGGFVSRKQDYFKPGVLKLFGAH